MRRTLTATLAVAAALLATPAGAAPQRPQVTDPRGDAKAGAGEYDVLSVTWETRKTGKAIKELVVTMRLAAAPDLSHGVGYEVYTYTPCGAIWIATYATPQGETTRAGYGECRAGGNVAVGLRPVVRKHASAISWTVPASQLHLKAGAEFYGMYGVSSPVEPLWGRSVSAQAGIARETVAVDYASSATRWRYGS